MTQTTPPGDSRTQSYDATHLKKLIYVESEQGQFDLVPQYLIHALLKLNCGRNQSYQRELLVLPQKQEHSGMTIRPT